MTCSLSGEAWSGTGNIQDDPLFVDAANADFHLNNSTQNCSPAIDSGDPASDFASESQDNGARINMGVYGNTAEAANACGSSSNPDDDSDSGDTGDGSGNDGSGGGSSGCFIISSQHP
jgi:hypothetical protein